MFHRFKIQKKKARLKEKTVIKNSTQQYLTNQVQLLTGLTANDFQMIYVDTITRFIQYLSEPNQILSESVVCTMLNQAIRALKKRQGYLLPLGADSEASFRQQEEWTFAVFVAALSESVDMDVRASVVKALLPKDAYAWLHRNKGLFALWHRYLQGDREHNVFAELVNADYDKKANNQPAPKKTETNPVEAQTEVEKVVIPTLTEKNNCHADTVDNTPMQSMEIREIDIKEVPRHSTVEGISVRPAKETQITLPPLTPDDFWRWLKSALHKKLISWNQENSFVHGVKLGVLIQIPEAINAFLKAQTTNAIGDTDELLSQQQAPLTKLIKKDAPLIKDSKGSRIHVYCLGKWEARQLISGIVVASDFLRSAQTISIHTDLMPDPLHAIQ